MRLLALTAALSWVVLEASEVAASPPSDPVLAVGDGAPRQTRFEWSTWLRGGVVAVRTAAEPSDADTGLVAAPGREPDTATLMGAIGVGFTLPVGSRVRLGPWAELRSSDGGIVGGEITVLGKPGALDLFWFGGTRAISLRVGANGDVRTAQLGVAYRAPWDLYGPREYGSRYVIGVGLVATATQSRHDPHDFTATLGVEVEPVGALRYLLGIRSWY